MIPELLRFRKTSQRKRKNYKGLDLRKFTIEDFELGSKLGKGKYGDVYIARELNTNLIVALKILNKNTIRELRAQKQVTDFNNFLGCERN